VKKCPSCGYGNPDKSSRCAICRRDLAAVAAQPETARPEDPSLLPASAMVLLGCAVLFYALQNFAWKPAAAPASAADEPPDYAAVALSLELMGRQRYLPDADKLLAVPLLASPDPAVARAAAGAAGAWLRAGARGETGAALFGALLGAAAGSIIGAALGIVSGSNVGSALGKGAALGAAGGAVIGGVKEGTSSDREYRITDDLRSKSLEGKEIPNAHLASGFLFFPGEANSAKELRLQLRERDTGKISPVVLRFK